MVTEGAGEVFWRLEVGLGGGDIWRGGRGAEGSCAELGALRVENAGRNGFEVTGVEARGAEGRVRDDCGVPGDVMGTALGVYVPKNFLLQVDSLLGHIVSIRNISVSFGIRGFDGNGGLRMIGRQYRNSPSITMLAVGSSE